MSNCQFHKNKLVAQKNGQKLHENDKIGIFGSKQWGGGGGGGQANFWGGGGIPLPPPPLPPSLPV